MPAAFRRSTPIATARASLPGGFVVSAAMSSPRSFRAEVAAAA